MRTRVTAETRVTTVARPAATPSGAATPGDLEVRFCLLAAAGDLDALTRLYAADAVVSLPRGREAAGHTAIRAAFAEALDGGVRWAAPASVRVIETGSLAMTCSTSEDGVVSTQVARLESDGRWVWVRDGSHLRRATEVGLPGAA
jgi:ketosteroid isomerase-like protein